MKILNSLLLFAVSTAALAVDYPTPSKSAAESRQTRQARREQITLQYASKDLAPPPTPPKVGMDDFLMTMISRMVQKTDLESVSANLLKEDFHPWNNGTDISIAGSICTRQGDYDFVLMGLIKMAYLDEKAGQTLLTPAARRKLRYELLSLKGNYHHIKFTLRNCPFVKIQDSENHILMSEISRYLTNQLLFKETSDPQYDNEKNGFNAFLLNHLSQFLRIDFDELNSRPYQGFTLIALANLYTYGENAKVKTMSQMILDYLSAKAAVQSKGLRRLTPFRRQKIHRSPENLLEADNTMVWYSFHTGNSQYMTMDKDTHINDYVYFMGAMDDYEVPALILDLFYKTPAPLFQKVKGRDVEIYFSSENFVLSAGGRHRKVFGYFTRDNDVWSMPTSIIPRTYGMKVSDLFYLQGPDNFNKRVNLCVAPNFACGTNLHVPANIPADCKIEQGPWTFYDLKNCSVKMGFYLATYQKGESAFWEVREPTVDFKGFQTTVLKNNPAPEKTYITSDAHRIDFNWSQKSLITAYDGIESGNPENWPLATGDLMNSTGDGLINIQDKLILDGRNILEPKRIEK
jgi:hypothetical protein